MKELDINTNDSSLAFLWYLATIKRFDAVSILRVIEKPHHNNEMYNQFLKKRNKEDAVYTEMYNKFLKEGRK
tara:strand:- start:178 stop:393 length:216 start_codon:yes stop_codon:yes gene_type:complete